MGEPIPRPAMATAPISVILFAHALSTDTDSALGGWRRQIDKLQRPGEILLIQESRPEVPNPSIADETIKVFTFERSQGFRDVINEAIRSAQYPLLAFCTVDRQYQPADLEGMLKLIDQVDLVAGYRAGGQAPTWQVLLDFVGGLLGRVLVGLPMEPRVCWLGSAGWGRRWIARWIFGVHVHDPECPYRLVRREVFERLPIQSGGPFVQVEMLAKANHLSCYLAESPVQWTPPESASIDVISFGEDGSGAVFRDPNFGTPVAAHA